VEEEPEYEGQKLTMFDVALAWPLQHPACGTVIAGMTKEYHVASNVVSRAAPPASSIARRPSSPRPA
jgi:aryl-alcohol dehydrogenase-like predicted oxidoreductase